MLEFIEIERSALVYLVLPALDHFDLSTHGREPLISVMKSAGFLMFSDISVWTFVWEFALVEWERYLIRDGFTLYVYFFAVNHIQYIVYISLERRNCTVCPFHNHRMAQLVPPFLWVLKPPYARWGLALGVNG